MAHEGEVSPWGFVGSTTSRARVTVYTQAGAVERFENPLFAAHRTAVVSVQVQRRLRQAGSFSFVLKATSPARAEALEDLFEEDDWVDIEIGRHGRWTHVMRGLIDTVHVSGVNAKQVTVSGAGFAKIFERTQVYYDPWSDGEVEGGAVIKVFDTMKSFFGDPARVTDTFLFGYLIEQLSRGRANWIVPKSMPLSTIPFGLRSATVKAEIDVALHGLTEPSLIRPVTPFDSSMNVSLNRDVPLTAFDSKAGGPLIPALAGTDPELDPRTLEEQLRTTRSLATLFDRSAQMESLLAASRKFAHHCAFVTTDFKNDPRRMAANPHILMPYGQFVWNLAREWSDPHVCELFPTLLTKIGTPLPLDGAASSGYGPDDTMMAVVFRDNPFLTKSRLGETVDQGPWSKLPEVIVPWRAVGGRGLARSGAERVNSFVLAPKMFQELMSVAAQLNRPLWNPSDILVHGIREFNVATNYVSDNSTTQDILNVAARYRERVRDFNCLNQYMWSGTIDSNVSRPDAQPGMKITIDGSEVGRENVTGYIEGVDDTWEFERGAKTSFLVTRGIKGGDEAYLKLLNNFGSDIRWVSPDPNVINAREE